MNPSPITPPPVRAQKDRRAGKATRKVVAHLEWDNTNAHLCSVVECRMDFLPDIPENKRFHEWGADNEEGKQGEYVPHGLVSEEDLDA